MGTLIRALCLAVFWMMPVVAHAQGHSVLVPRGVIDHSAYRVDVDIFGWNKELTEMGVLAIYMRRYPKGKYRGEESMIVLDVGKVVPKENVHLYFYTQSDNPLDPNKFEDARKQYDFLGYPYKSMWPVRPRRKKFPGAMTITPLWDFFEVEPGMCGTRVGFMLGLGGARRYQPQLDMRFQAKCAHLRMTDYRTYWVKKNQGAVMIRFDYSPTDNELSVRMPLSAAWRLAKKLNMVLRVAPGVFKSRTAQAKQEIKRYGKVRVERSKAIKKSTIRTSAQYWRLGVRIAKALKLTTGLPVEDMDVLIELAAAPKVRVRAKANKHRDEQTFWDTESTKGASQPKDFLEDFSP